MNSAQVVETYITQDPGLPRQNPTKSYWQHVPHAISDVQSAQLPTDTDIAVIGSGITGASVIKTLLDKDSSARITVFEARTLCSGATGRNGGQLATNAGEIYAELKERFGSDMAGKIAAFTFKTCERMRQIIAQYAPVDGEYREVTKVRAFLDDVSLAKMKDSIAQMEADHPSLRGIYKVIDSEAVLKTHGVHGATGGVTLPAAAMWPYRVVCNIFQGLLDRYADRLTIETNTPVTAVELVDGKYILTTPRGQTTAREVLYCTNGYTGHLLPKMRGLLFPVRGTMSVQDLGPNVPNKGASESFGFHYEPYWDEETQTLADGLWYLTQNAKTGYFFFGGEKGTIDDTLTADDTVLTSHSLAHLQNVLPQFFRYADVKEDPLVSAWSGVMCFTADGAPFVGRLPSSATDRHGDGEWLAAGYSGYGMPYCWLVGEALANMVLGLDVTDMDWLPEAYLIKEERLSPTKTADVAEMLASFK
ncbi:FAD dependent oxidoreductase [Diaporthe sp. PMI_573]|nr:FAD dependent oxidoreductase [Diaporthaceae sp. PMI_573]